MLTIFDIKRFAIHDGPGIRTTVFLKGCPLKCAWCHNPESIAMKKEHTKIKRQIDGKEIIMDQIFGTDIPIDDLLEELARDQEYYTESGGGVTISGGEPLMQHAGVVELLIGLQMKNIHTVIDTSGYANAGIVHQVAKYTDMFLYDLKSLDDKMHRMYTGVGNEQILANAEFLMDEGKEIIFRIPLVPGVNDREQDIEDYLRFFSEKKEKIKEIHLLPFHKIGEEKYRRLEYQYSLNHLKEPTDEDMEKMKDKISASGVIVRIGG